MIYAPDFSRYAEAVTHRLLDRKKTNVTWPEVAVIGPDSVERFAIVTRLRRAGIATVAAPDTKKALRSDPDWLLFADSLRIKSCHDEGEMVLFPETLEDGALFSMNVGYLPSRGD